MGSEPETTGHRRLADRHLVVVAVHGLEECNQRSLGNLQGPSAYKLALLCTSVDVCFVFAIREEEVLALMYKGRSRMREAGCIKETNQERSRGTQQRGCLRCCVTFTEQVKAQPDSPVLVLRAPRSQSLFLGHTLVPWR